MAFQEVNVSGGGEKFKFESKGDKIEGHYLGDDTINIAGKEVIRHTFKTAKATISTLGSYQLNEVMEKVTPGQLVRVTYTGDKALKAGKSMKTFKLEVDNTNTITVTGASNQTNSAAAAIAAMKAE